MTHPAFVSAMLKIERADRHIHELHDWCSEYSQPQFHRRRQDVDPASFATEMVLDSDPPFPEIALSFGDAVHNMRSALDHAAVALVSDDCDPAFISFPFHEDRQNLVDALTKNKKAPIYTASDTVKDIILNRIKSFRDCKNTGVEGNWPLWAMNKLDNIDKHRKIVVTPSASRLIVRNIAGPGFSVKHSVFESPTGENRQILGLPGAVMHADDNLSIEVFVDEAEVMNRQAIIPTAIQFLQLTQSVIETLREAVSA